MAISELDQMKQGVRAAWAAGDYAEIARRTLWPVGERIVRRAGVAPGEDVLDVACGTGNAALRAAAAGARVVGVDLTPEMFDAGRRLAAEAGVHVEWVEGDAESLPVEDERFDVVVSVFGCMFAPRHRVAAAELARVLRPGGRLCLATWTPDGETGKLFRTLGAYMPPPPRSRSRRCCGAARTTSASSSQAAASSSPSRARRSPSPSSPPSRRRSSSR